MCAPLVVHEIVNVALLTATGSLKVTSMFASFGTSAPPLAGEVLLTNGAVSGGGSSPPVTVMSSIPTHSSLPIASAVIQRTWTSD